MNIIRCMNNIPLPRALAPRLTEHLRAVPVVVLTGARQTGKSTLVQMLPGRRYVTLDDFDALEAADRDPDALLGGSQPVTIDEIQRAPRLLLAIKRAVDRSRTPGRFLLTGSANLLLMKQVSESLAGRASYLVLRPMAQGELAGLGRTGFWDEFLRRPPSEWLSWLTAADTTPRDWLDSAVRGGYPPPALHMRTAEERRIWFEGYVRTYLERDLRQLAEVSSLADFRRLMLAVAHRNGRIINQTELARDCVLSQPTVHRWLNLLEASHLIVRLPAYAVNRTKRLIKSPKVYWNDSGLAHHLAANGETGELFENLICQELLAWRDARSSPAEIHYWRTTLGEEVDFVIESEGRLLPIEVKATRRPTLADTRTLRVFRKEYGRKALPALLIHAGETLEWLAPDVLATPWWRVI